MSIRASVSVPLTRGLFALVDEEDAQTVLSMTWHVWHGRRNRSPYAATNFPRPGGGYRHLLLHRFVLREPAGAVDHINGDTLDNRRANLRVCTAEQNAHNARLRLDNQSGYKGVSYSKGRWMARVTAHGTCHFLGLFDTPEAAAERCRQFRAAVHGEFARDR